MTRNFFEFLDQHREDEVNKLTRILDFFDHIKGFHDKCMYSEIDNPYLFVRVHMPKEADAHKNKESEDKEKAITDMNLGFRIFILNDKLMYRLQQGPVGYPVGDAQMICGKESIEAIMQTGKTEDQAHNEVLRKLPEQLKIYMGKVISNIEKHSRPVRDRKYTFNRQIDPVYRNVLNTLNVPDKPIISPMK